MIYLIIGVIIFLIGFGIARADVTGGIKLLGVIVSIIGGAIGLKGRRELDKFMGRKDK
jgi:hypothetical protein